MRGFITLAALFAVVFIGTSQGINIALSGTSQEGNQAIIDFLVENFDATVTFGDYSDPANIPAGTELFIIGRVLYSGAYSNAANSATFNALTIPVICFTSYVARPDSDRWGWHSGPIGGFYSLSGNETTVTEAGSGVFGGVGPVDWWNDADWQFSAPGTGSVGDGQILAASPTGDIVVAHWKAGDMSGTGVVFGSDRLLFNVPDQNSGNPADLPNTPAGSQALIDAFNFFLGPGYGPYDPLVLPDNDDGSSGTLQANKEDVEVTLTFKAGGDPNTATETPFPVNPDILGHYIYLSQGIATDDPNVYLFDYIEQESVTDPNVSYGPFLLINGQGKTFYWQVEEGLDDGTGSPYGAGDPNNILGPVWSFVAQGASPSILSGPEHALADAGGNASFTVTASVLADNFRWFRVVGQQDSTENSETDDVELSDGGIYSTTQTATLTVTGATEDNRYYCIAYNGVPGSGGIPSVPSPAVWLWIPRLVTHHPFEAIVEPNTVVDMVGDFDMALLSDDAGTDLPVLAAGVPELDPDQYGLLFDNSDSGDPAHWAQYAEAATGAGDYKDITISVWVNWGGGEPWQRIIDFGNSQSAYMFLTPAALDGGVRFAVSNNGEQSIDAGQPLPTGEWTYVTATLGGDTARLYINGQLEATGTITHDPVDFSPALNNYIGKSQWPDPYFNGLIDDLTIYNYARTTEQIAQDYLDVRGDWVCNNELNDLQYDLDGDCRIGLGDLAMLIVEEWMDSYRIYPE